MFAKVFEQILDSSLAEDYRVRHVFEDLLKLADKNGIVDSTPEAIARRLNMPLDLVRHGITELEKPDPSSRTPDKEGRRIERLDGHRDWGWRIVNFTKYRESADRAMLRMGEAARKKEWRRRKGFSPHPSPNQNTEAEAEGEADQSRTTRDTSGNVQDTSGTGNGANPPLLKLSGAERITREKELDRVEAAIGKLRDRNRDSTWSPDDKALVADLKERKTELLGILGMKV